LRYFIAAASGVHKRSSSATVLGQPRECVMAALGSIETEDARVIA
jgi:hypothetical protein